MNVNAPPPRRPPAAPYEERREQPWWTWLLVLLAVILLGAIGFLGAQVIGSLGPGSGSPTPSAETFAMPDWADMTVAEANIAADELGLEIGRTDREASDEVEEGRIISTDPPEGETVQEGQTVDLVVSSGADTVAVPNVIGQTEEQATQTLRAAGLEPGPTSFEPNSAPEGRVIRTNPNAGVDWPRGGQVDIVLSSGPTPSPSPSPSPVPTPEPTAVPTPEPTAVPTPTPAPTPVAPAP